MIIDSTPPSTLITIMANMHFLLIILTLTSLPLTSTQPHRLRHLLHHHNHHTTPIESIEVTPPLPTTKLPTPPSKCIHTVFQHSFANTYNHPPYTTLYSPPPQCPPPWSHIVLNLSGSVSGEQYDRIAGVWLEGCEILRTSTPQPDVHGTFWNVLKDVTRYTSILQKTEIELSMMLENLINDEFTGIYHINLTLTYYKHQKAVKESNHPRKLGFRMKSSDEKTADLIIPVANNGNNGHWFRIEHESDTTSSMIQIPKNAKKIMLELYVSYHGDDEFWYSNPPDEYIQLAKLDTHRGNGAYREVLISIDGKFVTSEVPFPVIFTGGVNPLVWEPIVAIGAFNLPSYDFELTPFLRLLVDGKNHSFEIKVANAIGMWLIDANLHIWIDNGLSKVDAKLAVYNPPQFSLFRDYNYNQLDGSFEIKALRTSFYSGWVVTKSGNFTTSVTKSMNFTSLITFENNGSLKTVEHISEAKTLISVISEKGLSVSSKILERKSPINVITSTVPGFEKDTSMMITNITHELEESISEGVFFKSVVNNQVSSGWMLLKDHSVLSGAGMTQQTLMYKDCSGCFLRSVEASDGKVVEDVSSFVCGCLFQRPGFVTRV